MKKKWTRFVIFFLALFVLLGMASFSFASAPAKNDNGKIAVLIDSKWNYANNWPQTDYLQILRETTSALDYLGYRFDVVNESITQQDLNRYALLISVASAHSEKITQFTKSANKTALILYELSPELAKAIGINRGKYVKETEGTPRIREENALTQGIISKYGFLPFWGAYENDFGPDAQVLLESPRGLPIITEKSGPEGRYIFLLTRALTWNAYNYIFLDNVLKEVTDLPSMGGVPYAMDVPVMIRLDDYCEWTPVWQAYIALTNKLTVAALMKATNAQELAALAQTGVEIYPHGYDHEDLSALTYFKQKEIITRAIQQFQNYTGSKPSGFVAPYNRINDITTKVCNETGLKWMTTYHGMAKIPRYYYKDSPNKVWVLGNRPEHFEDKTAVRTALEEGAAERKPLMFVEHPYARNKEGLLNASLSTIHDILTFAGTRDGVYLTGAGEYFRHLEDKMSVYCSGNFLFVGKNAGPGLTLTYPQCAEGKMIKLGNQVLMFYRKGAAVLPALGKGTYTLQTVENMPVLRAPGPGVVVKSAVYDTRQKISEILIEAFVQKEIVLVLDNMKPGSYRAELQAGAGKAATVYLSATRNRQLRLPLLLFRDMPVKVRIFAQ